MDSLFWSLRRVGLVSGLAAFNHFLASHGSVTKPAAAAALSLPRGVEAARSVARHVKSFSPRRARARFVFSLANPGRHVERGGWASEKQISSVLYLLADIIVNLQFLLISD